MLIWLLFVMVLGACVGSFLNVVIYRIPAGKSIVTPPSACPKCGHRLAWYDNVPVLGWLWLKGKCRYCATAISPQYPLIEAATALLFGGWFYVCYISGLRPDFAGPPAEATAIVFIVSLALLGGLIASTLIDARLFIIPLQIPWFVTAVALVMLPVGVWVLPAAVQRVELPPPTQRVTETQTLRTIPGGYGRSGAVEAAVQEGRIGSVIVTAAPWASERMTGAAIGAAVMLVIANVLLKRGVLPLSFAPPAPEGDGAPLEELKESAQGVGPVALLLIPLAATAVAAAVVDVSWHGSWTRTMPLGLLGVSAAGCYVAAMVVMLGVSLLMRKREAGGGGGADELEHFEPHPAPRREMVKEILFVAFPVVGAAIGGWVVGWIGGSAPSGQPLNTGVMHVVGGVLLGYLVAGGLVWAVRIGGTLGFGKEAMGLGDVHLMGAVGAVCGWEVGVLAFFLAPFVGLAHTAVSLGLGKALRMESRQIPYGPHLAAGTVVAMVLREPLVAYFGVLFAGG